TSRPSTARSTSQPFCSSLSRYIWAIRSSSSTKRTRRVADTYLTVEVFGLTAQQPGQRRRHRSRQLAVGGGAELLPLQHRQQRVEGGVDRRVAVGLRDRQPGFAVGDPEDLLLRLAPFGVVLGPLLPRVGLVDLQVDLLHSQLAKGVCGGQPAGLGPVAPVPAGGWADPDAPLAVAVPEIQVPEPGGADEGAVLQALDRPVELA